MQSICCYKSIESQRKSFAATLYRLELLPYRKLPGQIPRQTIKLNNAIVLTVNTSQLTN
jgi:hypothetical protein